MSRSGSPLALPGRSRYKKGGSPHTSCFFFPMVPFLVCTACVFDLNLTIGTREVGRPTAYVKPYGLIKFRPKKLNSHHWIALNEVIRSFLPFSDSLSR